MRRRALLPRKMATPACLFIIPRESLNPAREIVNPLEEADDQMNLVDPELTRQRSLRASSSAFAAGKRLRKQREARRINTYAETPDDSPVDDTLWMATPDELPEPRACGDDETAAGRQGADARANTAAFLVFAGAVDGGGSNAMIDTHTAREQTAQRVFEGTMAHSQSQAQRRLSCRAFPASSASPTTRARRLDQFNAIHDDIEQGAYSCGNSARAM